MLSRSRFNRYGIKVSSHERYSNLHCALGSLANALVVLASLGNLSTTWSFKMVFSPLSYRLESYDEERCRRYQQSGMGGKASHWALHAAEWVALYGTMGWVFFW